MLIRRFIALIAAASAVLCIGAGSDAQPAKSPSPYVLDYEMNRIDGTQESLEKYKGKVILMVNTASRCGLTPQYEALEQLYRDHKDRGLVVLGFPANNFMGQEPGTNKEIAQFCTERFEVSFPMFEKISVIGDDAHPLYKQLTTQPKPAGGEPTWNFTKYLIGRDGHAVMRFEPKIKPGSDTMMSKVEELLGDG